MELEGKVIAIIGDNLNSSFNLKKEVYILDNIKKHTDKNKILEALKMVNLVEDYLLKKSNDLSNTIGRFNNVRAISFSVSPFSLDTFSCFISSALFNNDFILIVEYSRYGPVLPSKSENFSISNI